MLPKIYKQEQRLRIANYKVGNRDLNGYIITKVFGRGDEYVIYEIETKELVESVKVYLDTETEHDESGIIKRYNLIRTKFVEVKGLLYKVIDKTTIKTIISQILIHGIVENPEEARIQFNKLEEEINKDYRDQIANRMRLLLSALLSLVLINVTTVITYANGYFHGHEHLMNLMFVCAAGSIGGYFSIAIGINNLQCEKDVNKWLYVLYGIERVTISMLAAIIIYFAIKADVIFGICNTMPNPLIGHIIFGIAAGFSETLVPNLLKRLEENE